MTYVVLCRMIDVFLVQAEIDLKTDWEMDLFMAYVDTAGTGGVRPKALLLGTS